AGVSPASLRRTLPPPLRRLLAAAEATATERGVTVWAVGGAPRDLVMGEPINDLDLAIDGATAPFAKALANRLPDATGGPVTAFGTSGITLTTADGPIRLDLARLRSETYDHPGALPSVRWTHDIERDLARRDYSVNAIALGLTGDDRGRVVDPFEGIADARARRLRVLHPRSFEDDATRLWRGARVAASRTLRPDGGTASLIQEGGRWASTISGDRWFGELDLTARRGRAGSVVRLLDRWGVLRAIDPAWSVDPRTLHALSRHSEPMAAPVLAALLLAPLAGRDAVLARLSAASDIREAVHDAARLLAVPLAPSIEALVSLERTGHDARTAAAWLRPGGAVLSRALDRWERTRPALGADEVQVLGVPRGPYLGQVLRELRRARYERTLASRAAEREAVRRFVEREGLR
ncbi:MAG: CCA tRNA nucleotidyltransferase, partial [Dehalococcoidia bacterium]